MLVHGKAVMPEMGKITKILAIPEKQCYTTYDNMKVWLIKSGRKSTLSICVVESSYCAKRLAGLCTLFNLERWEEDDKERRI